MQIEKNVHCIQRENTEKFQTDKRKFQSPINSLIFKIIQQNIHK